MAKQKTSSIDNKVSIPNSVKLIFPCVVVWNEQLEIIIKTTENIETSPGISTFYQEFETSLELEQFILENELIDATIVEEIIS